MPSEPRYDKNAMGCAAALAITVAIMILLYVFR
jgi:hypothetical protein